MYKQQFSKNQSIAFFDSGIGGLTVLREMLAILPFEQYIYYADTFNTPYGTKPLNVVLRYIETAVKFLHSQNIKMLVVACNTATSVAIEKLRKTYNFLIVGIEPAIKIPFDNNISNKVVLLATTLTLQSDRLNCLIDSVCSDRSKIIKVPADMLVTFAENFTFESKDIEYYIESLFSNIDLREVSSVVLGCTHFSYFKNSFKKVLKNKSISIIDGNHPTVMNASKLLKDNKLLSNTQVIKEIEFYGTKGTRFNDNYKDQLINALSYLKTIN